MIDSNLASGAQRLFLPLLLFLALALGGCNDDGNVMLPGLASNADGGNGGSGGNNGNGNAGDPGAVDDSSPPTQPVNQTRAGTVYTQDIAVTNTDDSTDTLVVQVMEPTELVAGESYPLVLHGHGYGGSRSTDPDAFQQRLRDAGYYVISIDQRGFGESSGTVRVMSPDFEGQSLVALLDWAEDLEGLARRANGTMKVGSYGGSYGGMYQWLLAGADPEERLRVIAPDIAPYDLTYSLNPNNVIKTGWVLALVLGGEAGPLAGQLTNLGDDPEAAIDTLLDRVAAAQPLRQDPVIYESVVRGVLTNRFPEPAFNLFRYHSLRYFCEDTAAGSQDGFTIGQPEPLKVEPSGLHKIDALITQGFKDTLFNFNEAAHSYDCLKKLGGDVRLLTHQSGHILPLSTDILPGSELLDMYVGALVNVPEFQGPGGSENCGTVKIQEVTFAWFEQKLRGQAGALDTALLQDEAICLSLAENDAIAVDEIPYGSVIRTLDTQTVAGTGIAGGLLGFLAGDIANEVLLQSQPLFETPETGAIIAGIPTIDIDISPLVSGTLGSDLQDNDCPSQTLPTRCDPIFFFALTRRAAGQINWELIDDQLTPIRGFGDHSLEMTGIAERLYAGDEVGVMIYGFHLQYPISFSRDLLIPAARINGTISLPILGTDGAVYEQNMIASAK